MSVFTKLKRRLHRVFYPPGTTPLKWKIHIVNVLSLFSAALLITVLFPYLPAMVKSWGVSEEDTGYYAGIVASMMFTGRIFGSYLWGWLADRYGRRPIMLSSSILLLLGSGAFGFTTSFAWAIATRFFVGIANGIVGTCKTVVSDLCDDSNHGLGVSLIMSSWNLGLILGPAIGGFLAEPSRKYPHIFPPGSFLHRFAFLLPPMVNCAILLIAIIAVYYVFPETYDPSSITLSPSPAFVHLLCALFQWTERTGRRILRADVSVTATDDDRKMSTEVETQINEDGEGRWKESAAASLVDTTDLEYTAIGAMREAGGGGEEEAIEMGDIQTRPAETSAVVVMLLPSDEGRHFDNDKERRARCLCGCFKTCRCLRKSRLMRICRNRGALLSISVYCTYSFAVIGLDELFSLWAATTPALGGLGFTTDDIGTVLLIVSTPVLLLTLILFPMSFQLCSLVCAAMSVALPFTNNFYDRPKVLWPLLLLIMLLKKMSIGSGFASTVLLINNSVPPKLLASVNGVAMTLTSLTRAAAPVAGGSLFSWSISGGVKIGFPFDEHFTFFSFGVVFALSCLLCLALPKRLNKQTV